MISLEKILKNIEYKTSLDVGNTLVNNIQSDSRLIEPGNAFVALNGTQINGHDYLEIALEKGASVVFINNNYPTKIKEAVYLENTNNSIGILASNFYGNPSQKMKVVGITGTNGKTTVTNILFNLFSNLTFHCGLISTIDIKIGNQSFQTNHTTPDAITLQKTFAQMVEEGVDYCFMEVSSHALDQGRTNGTNFNVAIFTNISHDHLDYHKSFKNYIYAKKKLFDSLPYDSFALVNKDDKNADIMLQTCKAGKFYFSLKKPSDFKGKIIQQDINGTELDINGTSAWYPLIGEYNASNLLAAYGTAFLCEEDPNEIITKLSATPPIKGRLETIYYEGITIAIDYAHTPDALENVLQTLQNIRTKNEELITVVGCGGNRDKTKRPIMGKIAAQNSTKVIFTNDNPRNENPQSILNEIREGVLPIDYKKTLCIENREEAIKTALMIAKAGDIILIAGKGHENYQQIGEEKIPFSDKAIVQEFINHQKNNR